MAKRHGILFLAFLLYVPSIDLPCAKHFICICFLCSTAHLSRFLYTLRSFYHTYCKILRYTYVFVSSAGILLHTLMHTYILYCPVLYFNFSIPMSTDTVGDIPNVIGACSSHIHLKAYASEYLCFAFFLQLKTDDGFSGRGR